MSYLEKININYQFDNIGDLLKADLLDQMYTHLEWRLSAYLEWKLKHPDAEMHINMIMSKHIDADLYDGKFIFTVDGKEYQYSAESFKIPWDIVSHATQHLKEQLAAK
jgi:hypothetical protein